MKKSTSALALAAMMMAVANGVNVYEPATRRATKKEGPLSPEDKKKRHQLYSGDQTMHDYVINGVAIRATSKKVARKIYQRTKGGER